MFVIPFLSCPLSFTFFTYKSTCVEIPIHKNGFIPRRIYKGTKEYVESVKTLPGYNIKTEFQPFLDLNGIRKDLIVTEKLNLGFCSAQSTNFFTKGDAIIWVSPDFPKEDKDACHWLMKHEICHIKKNDCFFIPLVPAICSIAVAIFSVLMMPWIPSLLITIAVGIIAHAIFSQYRERKADDFAITESSIEELKGGRRFFLALQQANLKHRTTRWRKIAISSSGENRMDYLHPSIKSRLKKIEHALKQKNVQIDDAKEAEKIERLKKFLIEKDSKLDEEIKKLGKLAYIMALCQ